LPPATNPLATDSKGERLGFQVEKTGVVSQDGCFFCTNDSLIDGEPGRYYPGFTFQKFLFACIGVNRFLVLTNLKNNFYEDLIRLCND